MSNVKIKYVIDLLNGKQSTMVIERIKSGCFNYGNNTGVCVTMYDTFGKYVHDWYIDTRYTVGMENDDFFRRWSYDYVLDYYDGKYLAVHTFNCSPSDES